MTSEHVSCILNYTNWKLLKLFLSFDTSFRWIVNSSLKLLLLKLNIAPLKVSTLYVWSLLFSNCFSGNRSKAPDKKPPRQKPPGQNPPTISLLRLLKRFLRNMPLTVTCSDKGPPILKKNPAPGFFLLLYQGLRRGAFVQVAFVQGLFVGGLLT